ncbi:MAG: retron system putative HNH endonuclease [Methylotenera sp.]|nr:retron system putative HNH endonuclease [Methylotenera sp.]MDP2404592.1 retron system putative HNH endonuclease [Methylotenera sp.]MDP3094364.1 retron system putative HNH endonuclease [Methylotenera sp.]MDZ4222204.1 retron system putative HNH endonuclease [Methylotenera sp.]
MRTISKQGGGGHHLSLAHKNPPQNGRQATSRWSSYSYKDRLLNSLLDEQFFLCCYSEIRADSLKLNNHIEHVQPKSSYPLRTFDYQNLAASALDSENDLKAFKFQAQEVFGGHAKHSEYDQSLFISCHQADCARYFAYLSDGRVVPAQALNNADGDKASYTIKTLNLNSPFLVTERRNWWEELEQFFLQHQADGWSIEHLAYVDIIPTDNKLSQFFTLTRQFFGRIAEQVLQQHAPELV